MTYERAAEGGGREEELLDILPDNPKAAYDMRRVIDCVADRGSFFEIKPLFAPMMITGFARMNGHTIGIIANQPMVNSGAITARAGRKERHFIDLCAAYHVPLLFLVDVPGVMTGRLRQASTTWRRSHALRNIHSRQASRNCGRPVMGA